MFFLHQVWKNREKKKVISSNIRKQLWSNLHLFQENKLVLYFCFNDICKGIYSYFTRILDNAKFIHLAFKFTGNVWRYYVTSPNSGGKYFFTFRKIKIVIRMLKSLRIQKINWLTQQIKSYLIKQVIQTRTSVTIKCRP